MAAPVRKQQPSPAEILDLIAARKAELGELLKRQNAAADESIVSGDEAGYQAAVAAVTACNAHISRLQSALVGANARTRELAEAQQRAAQAALRERFYKADDRLLPLAKKMENKIAEFVQVFREYVVAADEAYAAYPNAPAPTGLGLTNTEIMQQVGAELYRVGATVPVTGRPQLERLPPTIPGAKCPDFMMIAQPEKITPFSVVIEQCVQTARNYMENKQHAA